MVGSAEGPVRGDRSSCEGGGSRNETRLRRPEGSPRKGQGHDIESSSLLKVKIPE
jgi:hypothetical protein